MNPEFESLSLRILSALFNGGYQGLLLTLLVWLGLKLLPQTNAATRHAVGLVTLLAVCILPCLHFFPAGGLAADGLRPVGPTEQPDPKIAPVASGSPAISARGGTPGMDRRIAADAEPLLPRSAGWPGLATRYHSLPPPTVERPERWPQAAGTLVTAFRRSWKASISGQLALAIIAVWVAFAGVRVGKLAIECRSLGLVKRRGIQPPDDLAGTFEALLRQMRVGRRAKLLVVRGPGAPMAAGYWKPAVLLPANVLTCADGGLIHILRHELAHLRRGDDWYNLLQQVLKAAFFFHPAVWWLSRRLTLDREIACDDYVLAAARAPKVYALLLTEFAGRIQQGSCSAAPAGWGRHSQLKERITMILDSNRNSSTRLGKAHLGTFVIAAALLTAASLGAAPRLELAQSAAKAELSRATVAVEPEVASAGLSAAIAAEVSGNVSQAIAISGPRPKPWPAPNVNVTVPPPPVPLTVPDVDVQIALAGSHPVPAPASPPAPPRSRPVSEKKVREGDFMEQRIERLERLIESLMQGETAGPGADSGKQAKAGDKKWEPGAELSWNFHPHFQEAFEKSEKEFQWEKLNTPEFAEISRQAQREAQRAVREASRMAEEIKRATADAMRSEEAMSRLLRSAKSREAQRNLLESQRRALEIQMGSLQVQIERLEQERQQLEARVEEHQALLERLEEADANPEEPEPNPDSGDQGEESREPGPKVKDSDLRTH